MALQVRTNYTIYKSPFPEPPLPSPTSLFHFHFPPGVYDKAKDSLPAYVDALTGDTLTQGEVRDNSLSIGYGLRNLKGIKKGDVALIFSTNSLEYAVAFFACQAAGLIVTPASASYTSHELAYHIKDSTAKIAFIQPDLLSTFHKAEIILKEEEGGREGVLAYTLDSAKEVLDDDGTVPCYKALSLKAGNWKGEALQSGEEHSAAVLCYSSGTVNTNPSMRCICFPLLNQMILTFLDAACRRVYQKVHGLGILHNRK
jgi:4-coumarate--CoA ligase